jgi:hypothetical protein
MRKINYPFYDKDGSILKDKLEEFKNCYFKTISKNIKIDKQSEICKEIKKIDSNWDLKRLITADFSELVVFYTNKNTDCLNHFFKTGNDESDYLYSNLQRIIADFFISKDINIKTCFYCNIEYINSFNDKYYSVVELINYAPNKFLNKIINKNSTNIISKERKCKSISENDILNFFPKVGSEILNKLKAEFDNDFNNEHFTLDHILSKSNYPYFSLSLFNFVPCCYSCNSKFKLGKEFKIYQNLAKVIPSSNEYEFDKFVEFQLKFIDNTKDVKVDLTNLLNLENVNEFLVMFRLKGRYEYHKTKAIDMIDKRKVYSDSQIREIAKLLGRDEQSIKEDIFGKECFHSNNEPFEKYKQDIARQLGLV